MNGRKLSTWYSIGAAVLLAGFAARAEAGIVFANSASPVSGAQTATNSHVVTGSTFDLAATGGSAGTLTNIDGTMGLRLDPSTGTNVFQFRWSWFPTGPNAVANINGDISLRLFLGNVGSGITVVIQDIVFQETAGTQSASFLGVNHTITAGSGGIETVQLSPGAGTYTAGFDANFSQLTNTYITLSFTGGTAGQNAGTDGFQIDAISTTPEPGTLALFGLGALGLAGLVRRRRRLAATTTSQA